MKIKDTILVSSAPIIKNDNTYGVAIVSGVLKSENNEAGLISFNLINLFIIIIFIMFFSLITFLTKHCFSYKNTFKNS